MRGPTSHIYFSQRLRLHYVDWGNKDAPPMLLVHGGRDHCRNWDWVAERFSADYHIIAPDLRGHGDSAWMVGGNYLHLDYVYDIAQLIHQTAIAPVTIISHSMGAAVSLTYTGLYPDSVAGLVAIEGMGLSPERRQKRDALPFAEQITDWVDGMRKTSGRTPRRYPSLQEAFERMHQENPHLSAEQARHLTIHGSNQNEDGTYSWKFDNYIRSRAPLQLSGAETAQLHQQIACPTLLVRGTESWASDPLKDGRAANIADVRVENIEQAGHWVHHDQLDKFCQITRDFLNT
jgi:pimeloyl-ACP methyl ester carboxylesterase